MEKINQEITDVLNRQLWKNNTFEEKLLHEIFYNSDEELFFCISNKIEAQTVHNLLSNLNDIEKKIIYLHLDDCESFSNIAKKLQISTSSVHRKYSESLRKLRSPSILSKSIPIFEEYFTNQKEFNKLLKENILLSHKNNLLIAELKRIDQLNKWSRETNKYLENTINQIQNTKVYKDNLELFLKQDIDVLDLTPRIKKILKRVGINTVADLKIFFNNDKFFEIKGLGPKAIIQLYKICFKYLA